MYRYFKPLTVCAAAVVMAVSAAPADAALIFYDDRTAFDAATGPLTGFEDFEDVNLLGVAVLGPWDSTADDPVVSPGDIVDGVTFSSDGGLFALGPPGMAFPSVVIGPTAIPAGLNITLAAGMTAVGFDLFHLNDLPVPELTIDLFGPDDVPAGTTQIDIGAEGGFFGVISTAVWIDQIHIAASNGLGLEFIDNIVFGRVDAAGIPAPGSLALFGLGLASLGLARRGTNRRLAVE